MRGLGLGLIGLKRHWDKTIPEFEDYMRLGRVFGLLYMKV